MKLIAGERFRLSEETALVKMIKGKVEVYVATRQKKDFRQIFLMELNAGEAAFPSFDEFDVTEILIYAVEDSELAKVSVNEIEVAELAKLMRLWFKNLIKLSWLRLLADRGDDVLRAWLDESVIGEEIKDRETLWKIFAYNESIFSMMSGAKFHSEDMAFVRRVKRRLKQKKHLVDDTISLLLGEDATPADEGIGKDDKFDQVSFVMRHALKALHMPDNTFRLAPEMMKALDGFGIMQKLAQKSGMGLRLITLEEDWYHGDSGVILAYYNPKNSAKELAACIPQNEKSYRLVTYSNPDGIELTDEVAAAIDNEAFVCYASLPTTKLGMKDLFKFVFRQMGSTDWRTILIVTIILGIIPLVTPIVTQTIFADIIPILDREGLATVVQVAMVAGFTSVTLNVVRSIALLRLSIHIDVPLETALFARLLALPTKFFRQFSSGNLAARMNSLTAIQTLLAGGTIGTVLSFFFGFWSLFLMCYYSMQLTGIAMAMWLVYLAVSFFILTRLTDYKRKQTNAANDTAGILQQIFTGLTKFRVRGAEENAYKLWGQKFGEEWKWNYAVRWQTNYTTILSAVQPTLLSLALYYFAFSEVSNGTSTIDYSTFIAFQSAYSAFNTALLGILPVIQSFSVLRPVLENLQPILDSEPENATEKAEADILTGSIEVERLSFSYSDDAPEVLKDVSFKISAGESVAIVGSSGCGKSTLLRLLLGFEQPKSGAIYYDGQDLADLAVSSVRSQMGVVLQGGQLMTGDIFRNIVGISNLTLEDAWEAAKAAGIDEDIRQMPMQMQTVISEGSSNISGGQRQRILIARALAAKPSILIFDEATSALDNRTQSIVTESLDRLKTTRIIVAHRLSTIRNVDRIFVLDGGRIAESGTFDELVEKGGIFAGFVKRQVL